MNSSNNQLVHRSSAQLCSSYQATCSALTSLSPCGLQTETDGRARVHLANAVAFLRFPALIMV